MKGLHFFVVALATSFAAVAAVPQASSSQVAGTNTANPGAPATPDAAASTQAGAPGATMASIDPDASDMDGIDPGTDDDDDDSSLEVCTY
jgi:hypothetical protein